MARVKIGQADPDRTAINTEIALLRGLDIPSLRARWRTVFRQQPPDQLARHLLFRGLAYRLQADHLGELDSASQRLLDEATPEDAGQKAVAAADKISALKPGTILGREWNGKMHRVAVLADGFAWNGHTYASLSKAAEAITGTRWNGPRFFGLRGKSKVDKSGRDMRS